MKQVSFSEAMKKKYPEWVVLIGTLSYQLKGILVVFLPGNCVSSPPSRPSPRQEGRSSNVCYDWFSVSSPLMEED